mgnify:CR=1 FL=1
MLYTKCCVQKNCKRICETSVVNTIVKEAKSKLGNPMILKSLLLLETWMNNAAENTNKLVNYGGTRY